MATAKPREPRLSHDRRILLMAFASALPGAAISLIFLWMTGDYTPKVQWTLSVLILTTLFGLAASVRTRVVVPLQTLANLLAALREDDFSIRGRTANPDDPLGAALIEINALAETLHEQRLGAVEATALLRTVMEQIDVAVFAFDSEHRLRMANRTGERLMGKSMEHMLGRTAEELSLTAWFGDAPRVVDISPPGGGPGGIGAPPGPGGPAGRGGPPGPGPGAGPWPCAIACNSACCFASA